MKSYKKLNIINMIKNNLITTKIHFVIALKEYKVLNIIIYK